MADTAAMEGGKKSWINHVMATKRKHGVTLRQAMRMAKKTYKKGRRGGGDDEEMAGGASPLTPAPTGGRRRRGTRKTRRSRKH